MHAIAAFMATKLVSFWKVVQVELRGKYSTQRVQALFKYHDYVSSLRVVLVLLVTPLPCFLLILAVDAVPLRPISEGVHSSQLFFVRAFVCFWIASITAYGQIKHMVPPAPLSNAKIIYFSGIVAGITVGVMYALTLVIGYPLPFGIVTVSPVWVHLLLAPLLSWMKKARADPEVWTMCVNLVKIMVCQESLVFIYPMYFHFFTTVPDSGKTAFSLLLPVMKIILRGVLARTVVHLKDEIPQIVVINVDLFSALFSTYCIQNTPSLKTTGVLMAAKAIQTSVSLYDIELVVQRMRVLRKQSGVMKVVAVQEKHRNSSVDTDAEVQRKRSDSRVSSSPLFALIQASTRKLSQTIQPFNQITAKPQKTHGLLATIAPLLAKFIDDDQRGPSKAGAADATASKSIKYRYVRELRRVLYITEFVVLVNYVEVVIPLIFSAYLFAIHHLPNRAYYELMATMDDHQLRDALANVLLYAALQFVSLLVLNMVLWQRLQISAFHQLSFVLEKQWNQVQNRMILWAFYNVQASLQHFGSDYTFEFLWLRTDPTPSN